MKEIKLSNGLFTVVDDSDYEWLNKYSWQYGRGYARHSYKVKGIKKIISMHTMILRPTSPLEVDHINRNKLDNRRANLRIVTHAMNMLNRKSAKRGVYPRSETPGSWTAEITILGKTWHLGTFHNWKDAMEARINAERSLGI